MSRPKWLTHPDALNGRALKLWKSYAPGLHRAGLLTASNTENLRALCRILALQDAAAAQIEADGPTVKSNSGTIRQHPAIKVMFDAQKNAEPLLKLFELSGS